MVINLLHFYVSHAQNEIAKSISRVYLDERTNASDKFALRSRLFRCLVFSNAQMKRKRSFFRRKLLHRTYPLTYRLRTIRICKKFVGKTCVLLRRTGRTYRYAYL